MDDNQSWYEYTFTIFTPTYNRAATLSRVYESLRGQTFTDFEWLIVDDGSTDRTADLVSTWLRTSSFPIRYLYQENQGKHVAFNRAVAEARGKLFLTFDSDDECRPHALDRFKYHWDSIPQADRQSFTGVTALCVDQHGRLVGDRFPLDPTDSDSLEILHRWKVRGEKWGFHRTDILRLYPFPVIPGYRDVVPEAIVWNAIARKFKTRFVNETLRVYYLDELGRVDHLSRPISGAKIAPGRVLFYRSLLIHDMGWCVHNPRAFWIAAGQYSRFSFHSGRGLAGQFTSLRGYRARFLWSIAMPLGLAAYLRDRSHSARSAARSGGIEQL